MTKLTSILLVEDEERLQHVLAQTLMRSGYMVNGARSVAEAVAAALAQTHSVMVLDLNLPDGTGWGVLQELAAHGVTCETLPTIILSAGDPPLGRIMEFAPYAFLPKPFAIDVLLRLVAGALEENATSNLRQTMHGQLRAL